MKCGFITFYGSTIYLVLTLCSSPLFAARPFVTDDAVTVKSGKFELETAANYLNAEQSFGASFKHGVTDRMDIGLCFGHCKLPDETNIYTGATIGLKYSLIPTWFSSSFSTEFGCNTYTINSILTHDIGPFSYDANLGFLATAATNYADVIYGLDLVFNFNKFGFGTEVRGTQESINWWQIGIKFLVFDWLQIDSGLGGGFEKSPDLTATTGFWLTFPTTKTNEKRK